LLFSFFSTEEYFFQNIYSQQPKTFRAANEYSSGETENYKPQSQNKRASSWGEINSGGASGPTTLELAFHISKQLTIPIRAGGILARSDAQDRAIRKNRQPNIVHRLFVTTRRHEFHQ